MTSLGDSIAEAQWLVEISFPFNWTSKDSDKVRMGMLPPCSRPRGVGLLQWAGQEYSESHPAANHYPRRSFELVVSLIHLEG
eukprot:163491-Prorocentrum_lima.AAC.1